MLALLAQQEGVPLSSEIIAGSVNTNPALIRRLLSMLANAGLTASQLGAGGGALLAREPHAITLLDVYRAVDMEDDHRLAIHEEPNRRCVIGRHIHAVLDAAIGPAETAFEAQLERRSLADVMRLIEAEAR